MPCLAYRCSIRIDPDGIRNRFRSPAFGIEIDERPDAPCFAEPVGRVIVMGGIQTEIADCQIRIEIPELFEGNDAADAVVPGCIKYMEMEREIERISVIMERKQIKSIPEIKTVEIAVPAPGCVWIGIMSGTGAGPGPVFRARADLMPIGERMGVDAGAVTGEGEAVGRNQSGAYGREQSGKAEKLLKEIFIMKREFIPRNSLGCDDFSNTGMAVRKFFTF